MFRLDPDEAKKAILRVKEPTLQRFTQAAGSILIWEEEPEPLGLLEEAWASLSPVVSEQKQITHALACILAYYQLKGISVADDLRQHLLEYEER